MKSVKDIVVEKCMEQMKITNLISFITVGMKDDKIYQRQKSWWMAKGTNIGLSNSLKLRGFD